MKSPKEAVNLGEVDWGEITHKGLQRLLRTACVQIANMQKPVHQREESEEDDLDEETEDAEKEREKSVELAASRGTPAPIPTQADDFPESVSDKLPRKTASKSPKPKTKKA